MKTTPCVIVLDDDNSTFRTITQQLSPRYKVLATTDYRRAMAALESDATVTIFMVSQSFRKLPWTQVLDEVRSLRPNVKRVLQTSLGDLSDIVPHLHDGAIHQIISKSAMSHELSAL